MTNSVEPAWRRSSKCANGTCLEVAKVDGEYLIRDSKAPEAVLRLTADEWAAFVEGVRAGDFE